MTARDVRFGAALLLAAVAGSVAHAGPVRAEHPFIYLTREEAGAARRRIETDPWAKEAYRKLRGSLESSGRVMRSLFRCAVEGLDGLEGGERLAAVEKAELMRVVRSPAPRGGAQWPTVLRYDLLYDILSPEERRECEEMFRFYIENTFENNAVFDPALYNDEKNYSRYDARAYTRTNWLPNIIFPRRLSADLMAVALRDEELIRKSWAAQGSVKWYLDEYLCDTGFYSEEFSKMGSTPGALLLYCRGLDRLGLGELGFGYRGKGGATVRGHIESLMHLGYPRVDIGSARPHYPRVDIGDVRGSSFPGTRRVHGVIQQAVVMGFLSDGSGGTEMWRRHGAWGGTRRGRSPQWDLDKTDKMQPRLWFELGHAMWPDSGFDYFLAQMRAPGEDAYNPTLFFGLDPVDAATVRPPPAPSAVWPERGFVMLRADESPAYWESPAPAVAMRLATPYAHSVNDSFALAGFYAMNRPIYMNRHADHGYASGWTRSVQSHCGVAIDGEEPRFTHEVTTRHEFAPGVKFVSARSAGVYPGHDIIRSLFLTREYLLDITRLVPKDGAEHSYIWLAHAAGGARLDEPERWREAELPEGALDDPTNVRAREVGGEPWGVSAVQTCALEDPTHSALPRSWYDRQVGVRLRMLGAAGTTVYVCATPLPERRYRKKGKDGKSHWEMERVPTEVGGATFIVSRRSPGTTFAALHEPFEGGRGRIVRFERIEESGAGIAVRIVSEAGSGVDDRVMLAYDAGEGPVTLSGGGESFTFEGHAYVRLRDGKPRVHGRLRDMSPRAAGIDR